MKVITLFIVLALLGTGCSASTPQPTKRAEWRCGPLPETFRESDLIGTWQAKYSPTQLDTLVLKEDGTYQQTYTSPKAGLNIEVGGNRWWLERRPSGGIYVHLEKMRYCASIKEECERPEGGGGDWAFYDFCEDRALEMEGAVILALTTAKGVRHPLAEIAPRGILLMHMRDNVDTPTQFFTLTE